MDRPGELTAAALHQRYLTDVYRYVLQRVPSIQDAEDVTAEVFAAATVGLPRFRGQCPPYLWLLAIARRRIARSPPARVPCPAPSAQPMSFTCCWPFPPTSTRSAPSRP
jgi:hypothetical protein